MYTIPVGFNHLHQSKHIRNFWPFASVRRYCSSFIGVSNHNKATHTHTHTPRREFSTRVLKFMLPCSEHNVVGAGKKIVKSDYLPLSLPPWPYVSGTLAHFSQTFPPKENPIFPQFRHARNNTTQLFDNHFYSWSSAIDCAAIYSCFWIDYDTAVVAMVPSRDIRTEKDPRSLTSMI